MKVTYQLKVLYVEIYYLKYDYLTRYENKWYYEYLKKLVSYDMSVISLLNKVKVMKIWDLKLLYIIIWFNLNCQRNMNNIKFSI